MSTSTQTTNYSLSQYASGDPVKFLTNYNSDMAAIDTAIKAAKDSADAKTPLTRTIAALPLSADITLAQLVTAGLLPHPIKLWSGTWDGSSSLTVTGLSNYELVLFCSSPIARMCVLSTGDIVISGISHAADYQILRHIGLARSGDVLSHASSSQTNITISTTAITYSASATSGSAFVGGQTIEAIYGLTLSSNIG